MLSDIKSKFLSEIALAMGLDDAQPLQNNFCNPLLIVASSTAVAAVAKSCSSINNYVWYM